MNWNEQPKRPSFTAVAERRFRLAGKAVVETGHPLFVQENGLPAFIPVDRLEKMFSARPEGYVNLGHYDYLGLSKHPHVLDAAHKAVGRIRSRRGRLAPCGRRAHDPPRA